jgi:carbon storage regulator
MLTAACWARRGIRFKDVSMLVLSRRIGEKLVIGDKITIAITRIGAGRVSLAIEAPAEIPIRRAELPPREKSEGKGAA